jgi:hypothetical protein
MTEVSEDALAVVKAHVAVTPMAPSTLDETVQLAAVAAPSMLPR